MPEEESSLLLIKNPPNRVTIQLEEESEGKARGDMEREKAGEKNGETNEIAQGESEVDGK